MKCNGRVRFAVLAALILAALAALGVAGRAAEGGGLEADFSQKALPPSAAHPFGTDMLGRDMLARTIKGLSLSLFIGTAASSFAALIALIAGAAAASGPRVLDRLINWFIDLTMSIPHTVLLILISIACGRGMRGLLIGIVATHWPALARVIRAEALQIRSRQYIAASRRLGKTRLWIAVHHVLPHLVPQFFIGLVLLFPHAVLHESALSFLGFGLPPEQPAVGIILSEAMRSLSAGMWWQAVFPGLALALTALAFDALGECLKRLLDPYGANE
jgi:peptide/nickel transport system permease protein